MRFRPLVSWPGEMLKDHQRRPSPFRASWTNTRLLLEREARLIGGEEVVIQAEIPESKIKIDGMPYANAQARGPAVTVVVVGDRVPGGRLSFSSDRYDDSWVPRGVRGWQANVRAIAKGMEGLRAADRHGIMQGRQYAGFKELGSGESEPESTMSVEQAAEELLRLSGAWPVTKVNVLLAMSEQPFRKTVHRAAATKHHPDRGGDPAHWQRLQDVMHVLELGDRVSEQATQPV